MAKYALGVDFGTLSVRALVAEMATGRELAACSSEYAHGVMDEKLPDGTKLPPDWALQHPGDYLTCLREAVRGAVAESGVAPEDIGGIGVDFTASTMLAVDGDMTPLCLLPEFAGRPHAWVKLWKHHGPQKEADDMTRTALERGETFLARYGGKVGSEWMFPKILETMRGDPEVYERARFVEAGDWIVWKLCGRVTRSACMAGYKAFWRKGEGLPPRAYFRAVEPGFEGAPDKLAGEILPLGTKAGELTAEAAETLGLLPGTAVAVSVTDALVAVPGAGVTDPGTLLMILGTSGCHILLGEEERIVPGMCGAVEDGAVPGYLAYEAGQTCVGDHFNWFVDNCVPEAYWEAARREGRDMHAYLTRLAEKLRPGESGLIALDWWNGNRSVLVDADLTGLVAGLSLATKPEEVYRSLIEATAYGARVIVENFAEHGVRVDDIRACGGIAQKNPFLMQIYADVLGREIRVARSAQTPALGSAMYGAVAAGAERGGCDSIEAAARAMAGEPELVYRPEPEARETYEELYREYLRLHDLFGRGAVDTMKKLKDIQKKAYLKK